MIQMAHQALHIHRIVRVIVVVVTRLGERRPIEPVYMRDQQRRRGERTLLTVD